MKNKECFCIVQVFRECDLFIYDKRILIYKKSVYLKIRIGKQVEFVCFNFYFVSLIFYLVDILQKNIRFYEEYVIDVWDEIFQNILKVLYFYC